MHSTKRIARFLRIATPALAVFGISIFIQIIGTDSALARSRFCEDYAAGYADRRTGHVLGSAARTAIAGAAIGGLASGRRGARRGAAIGGGVGLVGGSVRANSEYTRYFNRAYQRCIGRR